MTEKGKKRRDTLIKKYGSLEAYKENLSNWGKKGYEANPHGFHTMTKEELNEARRKSLETRSGKSNGQNQ